ncbi:MAG: hypothetical protein SWC96_06840 [Thermodesulfobacteriota bacterium]|nr:hypothetical protein [Thermodesulfobacteriota bacterium]
MKAAIHTTGKPREEKDSEFRMKYFSRDLPGVTRIVETRIYRITKGSSGRFRDYCLVGLAILEQQSGTTEGVPL